MSPGVFERDYSVLLDKTSLGESGTVGTDDDVDGAPVKVLDADGQVGHWGVSEGKDVWYRYTCPGKYEIVPESERTNYGAATCLETDEDGQDVWYHYVGPGRFEKIPNKPDLINDTKRKGSADKAIRMESTLEILSTTTASQDQNKPGSVQRVKKPKQRTGKPHYSCFQFNYCVVLLSFSKIIIATSFFTCIFQC